MGALLAASCAGVAAAQVADSSKAVVAPTSTAKPIVTVADVVARMNEEPAQRVTEGKRSWKRIADAWLDMTAPPMPIGSALTVGSIHPKMKDWDKVAAWAKANEGMAKALHDARDTIGFALPYGEQNVDEKYRAKGFYVKVGEDGDARVIDYAYAPAIDAIAVYAVADMYRLLEEGKPKEAFAVATDAARLLRQLGDRVTLAEKARFFELLSESLSAHRDAMYAYRDKIPKEVFQEIALKEYPFLTPKRQRLEMPEGDRFVAEQVIRSTFDARGQADPTKFADVFGDLQSREKPLTIFGASRRWKNLAGVHGSLESSLQKLTHIYDDWWRRWRMPPYDAGMDQPTELSRTNPIRYGGVIYSIRDLQNLFEQRRRLIAEVGGTAMAAGVCGYRTEFGTDPDDREKAYAVFVRKGSDYDPWDKQYGRFLYRFQGKERKAVDTPAGRVWVDGGVLYARGRDHEDNDFTDVTPDGAHGDVILWPPLRALERAQGLRE